MILSFVHEKLNLRLVHCAMSIQHKLHICTSDALWCLENQIENENKRDDPCSINVGCIFGVFLISIEKWTGKNPIFHMALEASVNILNKLERKNRHIRAFVLFEYKNEQMKSLIILQQPINKHLKLGSKMMFSGLKKTGIAQNNGVKKREVSLIQ